VTVFASGSTNTEGEQAGTTYLLLRLGEEVYGVTGTCVREITRWHAPTTVPGAPPALPGIINQRGFVMPVVNVRPLLGLPDDTPNRATRYVILQHEDVDIALIVDAVLDLLELQPATFQPLPAALDPQRARLLHALVRLDDQPVALIDLAALIATLRMGD
jgi:purine-binding chemotaxis protein CheW